MPSPSSSSPELTTLLAAAVGSIPGGAERPGQLEMATAVAKAFETGEHLLVQAGTGTGKSLGYLVPTLHSGKRAVIATATIALQSQLVESDLPRLAAACAEELGRTPKFALLKGRHHYVCKAKLDGADADTLFDDSGTQWLGEIGRLGASVNRVREWAQSTATGDRAELDPGVDDQVWRHVSMPARECVGAARCPFGTECFAEAARDDAKEADIVVTNHALLAIDMTQGGTVLPPHQLLVVDEAHELTGQVTSAARAELTPESLTRLARRAGLGGDVRESLGEAADALAAGLETAPEQRLRPVPPALVEALTMAAAAAREATTALGPIANDDANVVEKNQTKQALRDVIETADRMAADGDYDVVWVDTDDRRRRSLVVAPLSVASLLKLALYVERRVVLTSATLAPGGRFDLVAQSVGLPAESSEGELRWRGLDVGSPFDYGRQGILYVAARLPRPTASGLSDAAANELTELVEAAGGRTLGLFSSRKAATTAAEVLRARTDFPVLVQGEDSLSNLVRAFRAEPRSCLVGVASLWQGVDVPGPACQLVVVDRLPFPRPDDPLMAARAAAVDAAGGSGFMSVSVPHAAVRLAQGAGRLIRALDDRGVVAVLDSRLSQARYGEFIRRTLPPFWYTTSADVVRAALKRLNQPVENTAAA